MVSWTKNYEKETSAIPGFFIFQVMILHIYYKTNFTEKNWF